MYAEYQHARDICTQKNIENTAPANVFSAIRKRYNIKKSRSLLLKVSES